MAATHAKGNREHLYLGGGLLFVRGWQWVSSLAVYISFSLLNRYMASERLGEHPRMMAIERLGMASFVYVTFILATVHLFRCLQVPMWTAFAVASIPGDLLILGLFIAKLTVLSIAGLPSYCSGLTTDYYIPGKDLRRDPKPGYNTIRFGLKFNERGELDRLCYIPRGVYMICVAAVYAYTLSVLFTVLILHRQRYHSEIDEKGASTVELARPPTPQVPVARSSRSSHESTMVHDVEEGDPVGQVSCQQINAAPLTPFPPRSHVLHVMAVPSRPVDEQKTTMEVKRDIIFERHESENVPLGRQSIETTSSFNPENYLVCDGSRPPDNPPDYTSRPSSLYTVDL